MDIASLKIDAARIEAGEWVGGLRGLGDLRLKVRGAGSIAYRDALARLMRAVPSNERLEDGSIPVALVDRVTGEALAESVLLDWQNLTMNGEAVPYSLDQARTWLTDPDFARLQEGVHEASQRVASAAAAKEGRILGNSGTASLGDSSGATGAQTP